MSSRHKRSSRSSAKRSEYPTDWSEWEWEENRQCFRRYRLDRHGEYEYDYGDSIEKSSNAAPRFEPVTQSGPSAYAQHSEDHTTYQPPLDFSPPKLYDAQREPSSYSPGLGTLPVASPSFGQQAIPDIVSGLGTLSIASPSFAQQADQLDPRFTIRDQPSRFFQIGRVFKVLWTEPASETANDLDNYTSHTVAFGQLAFSKIRRFVVIRKRLHCCLCLPILTYGGQGATKAGVRASDHAIVHDANESEPDAAPGELLGKYALRIVLEVEGETLDPMSRIDFGKVYTVQHNIKVMNVGRIHKLDIRSLKRSYNESMRMDDDDDNY